MINTQLLRKLIEETIEEIKDQENLEYFDFKLKVSSRYREQENTPHPRHLSTEIDLLLEHYSIVGELFNELLCVNGVYCIVNTVKRKDTNKVSILKLEAKTEESARFTFATFGL